MCDRADAAQHRELDRDHKPARVVTLSTGAYYEKEGVLWKSGATGAIDWKELSGSESWLNLLAIRALTEVLTGSAGIGPVRQLRSFRLPFQNAKAGARLSDEVRALIRERMRAICAGMAAAYQCEIEADIRDIFSVLVNQEEQSRVVEQVARTVVDPVRVHRGSQVMASEDFADMLQAVPGAYFLVGHDGSVPVIGRRPQHEARPGLLHRPRRS
jgi:hypothetical protein